MARVVPSRLQTWPEPFDAGAELDWGEPEMSRRLLREHLDQTHDGASRRERIVDRHVARLRRLLPAPPCRLLDAACGPGLYAVRLAALGWSVHGVDVGEPVLRHARTLARRDGVDATFGRADLRTLDEPPEYDAALLIYYVLEAFPRRDQAEVLRRLAAALRPGGRLVAEVRIRPDQPPGRLSGWDVVPFSLHADTPHLLLTDTTWDQARHTYVLREVAVLDDGQVLVQQTTGRLIDLDEIAPLFARAGLRVRATYDGWTAQRATVLSNSVLVVAERR